MKVNELINELKLFDGEMDIFLSSDEELNTLFKDIQLSKLLLENKKLSVVIWGNSGSEMD